VENVAYNVRVLISTQARDMYIGKSMTNEQSNAISYKASLSYDWRQIIYCLMTCEKLAQNL